jgi:hypothetical protein
MLRRLDKAFSAFFRRMKAGETPGFPRFKGYDRFKALNIATVMDANCATKKMDRSGSTSRMLAK